MNPLVLVILDGFGHRTDASGNSILMAKAPHWASFLKNYPHTELACHGEAVGLPAGTMGNSEVGHLTIGAGRIFYQDLSRINQSIQNKSFFANPVLLKAFETAQKNRSKVHLMGLLSDAGVHSHESHIFALLKMAHENGDPRVIVHCFLDGRDTPPNSSPTYVRNLQRKLGSHAEIGTLIGRYYAMDRDQRWDRVQIAYEALVEDGGKKQTDPCAAIEASYAEKITDEFLKPVILAAKDGSSNRIEDGDVVIFFNFRPDRARELTRALMDTSFEGFQRKKIPKPGMYVCMTEYDKAFPLPVAFPPDKPTRVLAEILSEQGIRQFHTAETEKYPHVTYFLNGGVEAPFPGEERLLIPSPREVATYDLKPEMSALPVTEAALEKLRSGCPVIFINFANPDMVGHTGVLPASIRAVETIDACLGRLAEEVLKRDGTMIITADHGNCEEMIAGDGQPHTQHTLNPVPLVLIDNKRKKAALRSGGGLQDIAPTILEIMGLPIPPEMTGKSLLTATFKPVPLKGSKTSTQILREIRDEE